MAITFRSYNHNCFRFMTGANSTSKTYKLLLLNSSATFDATHTTLAQVTNSGAYEVSGNGWPAGGKTLTNVAITAAGTGNADAKFTADGVMQLISGGSLGPFSAYVLACTSDAGSPPVVFVQLATAGSIIADTYFEILWPTDGFQYFSRQS
jgi:hypothetical protein